MTVIIGVDPHTVAGAPTRKTASTSGAQGWWCRLVTAYSRVPAGLRGAQFDRERAHPDAIGLDDPERTHADAIVVLHDHNAVNHLGISSAGLRTRRCGVKMTAMG